MMRMLRMGNNGGFGVDPKGTVSDDMDSTVTQHGQDIIDRVNLRHNECQQRIGVEVDGTNLLKMPTGKGWSGHSGYELTVKRMVWTRWDRL